ncbi:hypothetical protein ACRARG_02645 [Pseudooceanicola sp. C21-150M6]|uniref:hypothetical protein n=1 Tax=Pseudooceanicola sp. C21-150M6 TaxID=3434355 RepID=UPI003D7FD59C
MTERDTHTEAPDSGLEPYFAAARRTMPAPSSDLLARIGADAFAVQDEQSHARLQPRVSDRRGPLAAVLALLGGWPSLAGLATAGIAGLAVGMFGPAAAALPVSALGLATVSTEIEQDAYLVDPIQNFTLISYTDDLEDWQ